MSRRPEASDRLWRRGAAGQPPQLHASRCSVCGWVAFPAERYGCERCGALPAAHEPLDLAARGRVRAFAQVHRHHQPDPPAPFVVVQVDLPEGPSLKAVLAGDEVAVGDLVEGTVVTSRAPGDGGDPVAERFAWTRATS